jgi:hypothetical protein
MEPDWARWLREHTVETSLALLALAIAGLAWTVLSDFSVSPIVPLLSGLTVASVVVHLVRLNLSASYRARYASGPTPAMTRQRMRTAIVASTVLGVAALVAVAIASHHSTVAIVITVLVALQAVVLGLRRLNSL